MENKIYLKYAVWVTAFCIVLGENYEIGAATAVSVRYSVRELNTSDLSPVYTAKFLETGTVVFNNRTGANRIELEKNTVAQQITSLPDGQFNKGYAGANSNGDMVSYGINAEFNGVGYSRAALQTRDGTITYYDDIIGGYPVSYYGVGPNRELYGSRESDDFLDVGFTSVVRDSDGSFREIRSTTSVQMDDTGWVYGRLRNGDFYYWIPGAASYVQIPGVYAATADLIDHSQWPLLTAFVGTYGGNGPGTSFNGGIYRYSVSDDPAHNDIIDDLDFFDISFRDQKANAITLDGEVVGTSKYWLLPRGDTARRDYAWIWDKTEGMQFLEDFIDPTLHLKLAAGLDINEQGQILATELGNPSHLWLLTPIPEPTTALLCLSVLILNLRRRHE
jgi:hypothetical protein